MINSTSLSNIMFYMNYFQQTNSIHQSLYAKNYTSPTFSDYIYNAQFQNLPTDVTDSMNELKSSANNILKSNDSSIINSKSVEIESSAIEGSAQNDADYETYYVNVSQLAQAQQNQSNVYQSDDASALSQGEYTFAITQDGESTNISFSVEDGDTNSDVLQKIKGSINNSNADVTADVVSSDGTSTLQITSDSTGTNNSFQVSDVTGDSVLTLGLDQVFESAQDAKYEVDSTQYTSQSNDISLNDGKVNLTLKEVTDSAVKVEVKDDTESIKEGIKEFVSNFNDVMRNLSFDSTSLRIRNDLSEVLSSEGSSLSDIGIEVQNDGSLSIDEERLDKALETDPSTVKDTVGGFGEVAYKSKQIADSTLSGMYDLTSDSINPNSLYSYLGDGSKSMYTNLFYAGNFIDTFL